MNFVWFYHGAHIWFYYSNTNIVLPDCGIHQVETNRRICIDSCSLCWINGFELQKMREIKIMICFTVTPVPRPLDPKTTALDHLCLPSPRHKILISKLVRKTNRSEHF